ncbi:M56 family metallopeptidase [Mucilaginibacter sp. FT3.2]|uniref:M56 family metallopeptidase n=1 Tax=Mucilaginibacter sp. FT3.2 TaxID=2723090 RepID=UPI00161BE029|nr:M56 family metallopeptidase [Mucilaginibacter sp. FT3.2]MBB6234501.1 beta-lactamase regulating signal transducer with metallopeptidase domain [Mucilaginibacter sp. FT3.2]
MESVFYNISQVLGITIIHSLWQGLLVWFVLRLVFTCAPSMSSIKKHNWAMAAMLAITTWFVYTFVSQMQAHVWVNLSAATAPALLPHFVFPLNHFAHPVASAYYNYVIEGYLPYISAIYFIGLTFNMLSMAINWQRINHIKRTMIPSDRMQDYVDAFCQQLHITKYVSVNISRYVDVPCMIGFFSPIILLPISLTTHLSAEEIKAILLHELSHIKRNDYLLNLVQQFISILLFFNPFAQLINRIINQERENRCDDLVVQTTAQPLVYAHALLKLEQTRQVNLQMALAATGKKHHLLNRIERIMKPQKPIGNIRHLLVALAIITASISSVAWLNPTIANGKISIKKVKIVYPTALKAILTDTTHKKVVKVKKVITAKTALRKKQLAEARYNNFDDKELNRLSAEVDKYAEQVSKYYDSPEFKEQQKQLEEKGEAMEKFYNSPELKRIQEEQQKASEDFQKNWGETSETTKIGEQMGKMGEKIGAYYSSPEFKSMNEALRKKYGIKKEYNNDIKDENYKKYQDELQSKVSPEIKEQAEQLKKMGEEMRSHFDSPEFRKKRDELRMMGDSLRRAYRSPAMEEQKQEMRKLSQQMRDYQDNAQIKQTKAQLRAASKKLREYTNSPEFKKRIEDAKREAYNSDDNKE